MLFASRLNGSRSLSGETFKRLWSKGIQLTRERTFQSIVIAGFLIFKAFGSNLVFAADFKLSGNRDGTIQIALSGPIVESDGQSLRSLIAMGQSKSLVINRISLNSPGGSVSAGADLAILVRKSGISTYVDHADVCASACFIVFAGGIKRVAADQAKIGVHSATTRDSGENRLAKSVTLDLARFLADFGVPASILGRMVTAPPDSMAWLTRDELRQLNEDPAKTQLKPSSYANKVAPTVAPQLPVRVRVSSEEARQASQLVSKALSLLRAARPDDAVSLLRRATILNPLDAATAASFGEALYQAGELSAARDALSLAVRLNPKHSAAYGTLAQTLAAMGEVEWARECFVNYYQRVNHKDVIAEQLLRFRGDETSSANLKRAAALAIGDLGIR